jgi:hypothetical protein
LSKIVPDIPVDMTIQANGDVLRNIVAVAIAAAITLLTTMKPVVAGDENCPDGEDGKKCRLACGDTVKGWQCMCVCK